MLGDKLKKLSNENDAVFSRKLIPNINPETILGIKTLPLRQLAKEMIDNGSYLDFINELPHQYFEENQIHSFILSKIKDFDIRITAIEQFLPYVDNWATCDQLECAYNEKLLSYINGWLISEKTYTVRFAIKLLMQHYLEDYFDDSQMLMIAHIRHDDYYVKMMIAWYVATALAKQQQSALSLLERQQLEDWVHNKAIQKAIESRRITDEMKQYLRTLKIKTRRL